MELTLLTVGIACVIAAVIGGGLKGFGVEFPLLQSRARQVILALVGVAFMGGAWYIDEGASLRSAITTDGKSLNSTSTNMVAGGAGDDTEIVTINPPPEKEPWRQIASGKWRRKFNMPGNCDGESDFYRFRIDGTTLIWERGSDGQKWNHAYSGVLRVVNRGEVTFETNPQSFSIGADGHLKVLQYPDGQSVCEYTRSGV